MALYFVNMKQKKKVSQKPAQSLSYPEKEIEQKIIYP